jgi:hypothetical protein
MKDYENDERDLSFREVMDFTSNSCLYNRYRKMFLESERIISCSRCPYHKSENFRRRRHAQRSWKEYRRTQYKCLPSNSNTVI